MAKQHLDLFTPVTSRIWNFKFFSKMRIKLKDQIAKKIFFY